jgi:hypothetical protein
MGFQYLDRSNTTNYISTPKGFLTISIHSTELAVAIDKIELPPHIELRPDQDFLCQKNTELSLLPVHMENQCLHSQGSRTRNIAS